MLKTADSCGVNSGSSDTHPIHALNTAQTSITQRHGNSTQANAKSTVLQQIHFKFASVSIAVTCARYSRDQTVARNQSVPVPGAGSARF